MKGVMVIITLHPWPSADFHSASDPFIAANWRWTSLDAERGAEALFGGGGRSPTSTSLRFNQPGRIEEGTSLYSNSSSLFEHLLRLCTPLSRHVVENCKEKDADDYQWEVLIPRFVFTACCFGLHLSRGRSSRLTW